MKVLVNITRLLLIVLFGSSVHAADKLTVALEWYVNPDHGPLIIAEQKGYFADAGLDVELIVPSNPNDPPKLVAAKSVEIAVFYQPQVHFLVEREFPIIRVGTLVATPLNCIVVRRDSDIQEVSDLKGKKVGFSVAGFEDILLEAVLNHHSMSISEVEMVNVNFSLSPSLMSKQVDAVIGAYRNFELHQMDLNGVPGRAFYLEEIGIPPYDELVYIIHADNVDNPAIRRFVEATERAVQFIVNHPDEAWELFVDYDKALDNELNRLAWHDTIPRFALRPGALDTARYENFAEFLLQRELIDGMSPVSSYAVELQRTSK